MKYKICLALCYIILAISGTTAYAQMPYWEYWGFHAPFQPEQDACNAIKLCGPFTNPKSYFKTGHIQEPYERYSHWLKLEIATAGSLSFKITPRLASDNYDFYVFKQAQDDCNAIVNATPVRGNNAPVPQAGTGITGITGLRVNAGSDFTFLGYWFSNNLDVAAGDNVYIMISNFGPRDTMFEIVDTYYATKGYEIEFTGSTCSFYKDGPVAFDSIPTTCNNYKEVYLYLSKYVQCNSIEFLASDFQLNNGASVYTAVGVECSAYSTFTDVVKLEFAPYLPSGTYTLSAKQGSDGNTLLDICGDELPLPENITIVVPKVDSVVHLTICPQQLPFSWNGQTINTGGDSVATFISPSAYGCDSLTTLSLTVLDTLQETDSVFICASQLPYTWHGISVAAPGNNVAQFVTVTANGCDSVIRLNLGIIQPQPTNVSVSACGPVVFENQTYTASVTFLDTLQSSHGCDSLYRTIDIVVYPAIIAANQYIDTGGCGYLLFNGEIYRESVSFKDTLRNQHDCDSVYRHYNITILPNVMPDKAQETVIVCDSFNLDGRTYFSDTSVNTLIRNRFGCDSLLKTIHVQIRPLELELLATPPFPVKGDYVMLTTSANQAYAITGWSPPERFANQLATQQTFFIQDDDTFRVIGISEQGCIDTASVYLRADSLIPVALMPNAFSPNGDGLNDEFTPFFVNKSGYVVRRFFIYNKWGQEVYHGYNLKKAAWNGLYGNIGRPAEPGTYFYIIDIEFIDKTKTTFKGEVILIH